MFHLYNCIRSIIIDFIIVIHLTRTAFNNCLYNETNWFLLKAIWFFFFTMLLSLVFYYLTRNSIFVNIFSNICFISLIIITVFARELVHDDANWLMFKCALISFVIMAFSMPTYWMISNTLFVNIIILTLFYGSLIIFIVLTALLIWRVYKSCRVKRNASHSDITYASVYFRHVDSSGGSINASPTPERDDESSTSSMIHVEEIPQQTRQ